MRFIIHYYTDLCGRSLVGIAVLNPTDVIDVFLL
jgi:hypothetical protein